ncbi:MAG: hypothetical protein AB9873_13085 [Syntrophobacteraceae bacterium]
MPRSFFAASSIDPLRTSVSQNNTAHESGFEHWKDQLKDKFDYFLHNHVEKLERIENTVHYGGALIGYLILSLIFKNQTHVTTLQLILYLFGFVGYVAFLSIICKWLQHLSKEEYDDSMRVRYALVSVRELGAYLSQLFSDIADRKIHDSHYSFRFHHITKKLKYIIARMVFNQISFGNSNLDIRYRVTLFEPISAIDDYSGESIEVLKGAAFYNSERLRPRTFSLNLGYKECEGAAGWAWHYRRPFCISDVRECLRLMDEGYLDRPVFKTNFPESHDTPLKETPLRCRSIICYPVIIYKLSDESVKAILCIDCDKANHITTDTSHKEKILRIQLYPYVRMYALLYSIIDLFDSFDRFQSKKQTEVDENEFGKA